jgi:hypothetical protein
MSIMNKLTAAYLAGVIDSDGCIDIYRSKRKGCVSGYSDRARVRIGMMDKELIEWLKKSFGGYLHYTKRVDTKSKAKPFYVWHLDGGKQLKPFIDAIYPYLKVKKKQAETLKEFMKTFETESYVIKKNKLANGGSGVHKEIKAEILKKRNNLFKLIRKQKNPLAA